jgi:uncharacterized membrane protein YdjX (TVP38/TMEM64 family)
MRLWQLVLGLLAVILVPFFLWERSIQGWTNHLVSFGYGRPVLALGLGALLASDLLLPVPSSLASTAAGALLGFWGGLVTSFLGMTAGSGIGYWIGSRMPADRLLSAADLDRLRRGQEQWGDWMLVVFRSVPVLAEASVIFAGLSGRPVRKVMSLTALSNLGISVVYAGAGAISARGETFLYAFLAAVALPGVAMLLLRRRRSA